MKNQKKLDREISRAWSKEAHGVQVNIMDIPAIFARIREAVQGGADLAETVRSVAAEYRIN